MTDTTAHDMPTTADQGASDQAATSPEALPTRGPRYAPSPLQWEGGEHTYIGNIINLQLVAGQAPVVAGTVPLALPNGLSLTYGQILALGGDFYGLPDTPISEDPNPPSRFVQAFQTLANDPAAVAEAKQILQVMQIEIDAVNNALKNHQQPSTAYEQLGDTLSGKWNRITGGGLSDWEPWYPLGRYLKLAATNWDHFCPWSIVVYMAGHGAALAQAQAAPRQPNPAAALQLAYAMNAFADHYLSDAFSAGHMRTPRKQLHDTVTPADAGSLCSRYMHDEDCHAGLNVKNKRGDVWKAYGDKRLLDDPNATNLAICVAAVQASANDVWAAYQGNPPSTPSAVAYMPNYADLIANPSDPGNAPALFIESGGTVQRRTTLSDHSTYAWTSKWVALVTLGELKLMPEFDGDDIVPYSLPSNLLTLVGAPPTMGMGLYGPTRHGFARIWSGVHGYPLAKGDTFATGDVDGDGHNELVQLSFGPTATVFAPLPGGQPGYQPQPPFKLTVDAGPDMPLLGDVDGDGAAELVLPCGGLVSKQLAMTVARLGAKPQMLWHGLVQWGNGFDAFGIADIDGDGRAEVIVITTYSGQLALAVFRWDAQSGSMTMWSNQKAGGSPGVAAPFMVGDVDDDGAQELVRVFPTPGQPSQMAEVYGSDGKGGVALRSRTTVPAGAQATVVDVDGDGKAEVVLLVPGSPMAASVWGDDGKGGLKQLWSTADLGTRGPALAITTLIGGPNLSNQVAYLYDNGGKMNLDALSWSSGALVVSESWPGLDPTGATFAAYAVAIPLAAQPSDD